MSAIGAASGQFTRVIAFGDSLTDRGNTVAEFGILLNGTDAYNSNFYANGRWSDGPLWIEIVNDQFGNGAWSRNGGSAFSIGSNFAWGGSTSGSGRTSGVLDNLQTQILSYRLNAVMGPIVSAPDTKLFSIWSGGNDVINAVQGGKSINVGALSTTMANNIAQAVTTLYNLGGRHFIVPNLPDLARKPNYRTDPFLAGQASAIVNAYNPKLAAKLESLQKDLSGITIYAFDAFSILNEVIATPGQFGLLDVTQPAYVSDPSLPLRGYVRNLPGSYLFWDTTHPTTAGHVILGQNALELIARGPGATVGRDVTKPKVRFVRRSTRVRGETLRLVGRASDDGPLDRVEWKLNRSKYQPARRTERWRAKIALEPGKNVVRVRAVDVAGNVSRVRRYVVELPR